MVRSLRKLPGEAAPSPQFDFGAVDDDFVHFFQDVWHLKDWLKNDPSTGLTSAEVESFAKCDVILRLAGDLANGSKHLTLSRAHTGDLRTGPRTVKMSGDPTVGLRITIEVESGSQTYDATDVARNAVQQWRSFLESKDLL